MSINSISNIGVNPQQINENAKSANTPASSGQGNSNSTTNTTTTDTVNLTGTASQLRALEQQLANQPVVDVQRVESIKREIASGTYEVNSQQVADKMIQIESAISNRQN